MDLGPEVVVGFDGSPGAARAVRFAAEDAARRRRPLRIVQVRDGRAVDLVPDARLTSAIGIAEGYLAREQVLSSEPGGKAAAELVAQSQGAELLVIGRGHAHRRGLGLGSVASDVVGHAKCPVAVIATADNAAEDPEVASPGVVVGIKYLEQSDAILEAAFVEAGLRGCGLQVLHAWRHPEPSEHGDILPSVYDPGLYGERQEALLGEWVEPLANKYPDVTVSVTVRHAGAVDALVEADAELVVIGAPHRGLVRPMMIGSVTQGLLRNLDRPVIFVHRRHAR